jgi:uncharacterized protein
MSTSNTTPRAAPRRHSRFRIAAFRAIERAAWCLGGRALYRALNLRAGRFDVREERVEIEGLDSRLEGFTVVQLSDMHGGSFLAEGDLADVVRRVNALDPDVVAITGDFITHHWTDALLLLEDCARLSARHGVFAVFGNHDYKDRLEGEIAAAYGARGIRFLRNESVRLSVAGAGIAIVGLEDLEEARDIDIESARAALQPGDVEIALCHNPSGASWLARPGCAVILSGHTHGTQIDLPLLRELGPKHPGLRVRFGPTLLIVSRGLGVVGVPLRVGARAEIVIVRLSRRDSSAHDLVTLASSGARETVPTPALQGSDAR